MAPIIAPTMPPQSNLSVSPMPNRPWKIQKPTRAPNKPSPAEVNHDLKPCMCRKASFGIRARAIAPATKPSAKAARKLPRFIEPPSPRPLAHPGSESCPRNGPISPRYADLFALQGSQIAGQTRSDTARAEDDRQFGQAAQAQSVAVWSYSARLPSRPLGPRSGHVDRDADRIGEDVVDRGALLRLRDQRPDLPRRGVGVDLVTDGDAAEAVADIGVGAEDPVQVHLGHAMPPTRRTAAASGPAARAGRPGRSTGPRRRPARSSRSATSRRATA